MKCPVCQAEMTIKGQWPGDQFQNTTYPAEILTFYQCPKCQNIELEKS